MNSVHNFIVFLTILFCSVLIEARNYRHTSKELSLTNKTVISQRNCARNETAIFVHTAAHTAGKYFERRMTIRRTWAQEAVDHNMRVMFVIGLPRGPNRTHEQRLLKAEADQFGDMLQFNFVEDYYNLTLKAIAELKWAYKHCNKSRYLVKLDDDVILNVPMLYDWIVSKKIPSGWTGRVAVSPANRQLGHKWYMPRRYYDKESYRFLSGFGYILSMNRLKRLMDTLTKYKGPILDIDDLFLTGIVADYGNIRRYNSRRFKFYCGLDLCTIESSLAIHACHDNRDTETMYRIWRQSDTELCYLFNERPFVRYPVDFNRDVNTWSWNTKNFTADLLKALGNLASFVGVSVP